MNVSGSRDIEHDVGRDPVPAPRHHALGDRGRHVLMTVDAVGGIWTYALDLGTGLHRLGFSVTLAVLGPAAGPDQRRQAEERGLVVANTGHSPDWLAEDAGAVEAAGAAVASLAQLLGADLVHLNHPALAADARFDRPFLAVCHSCVATWWQAVRRDPLPEDFRWRTALVERGLKAARVVVAPSRAFAEATRRTYGLASLPLVVPNGRAPGPAASGTKPADLVFTAGRLWDEGKNLAILDRVAARIAVPIEAAGSLRGPNGSAIAFEHVRALGALDEAAMRARLAARPIYVSPALYEPFGLAVLEAALAGCALVLADIPTFREVWEAAAIFVPATDEQAIAAAIDRLLGDADLRAERGQAAERQARRYTVEALASAMDRAYATALGIPGEHRESAA